MLVPAQFRPARQQQLPQRRVQVQGLWRRQAQRHHQEQVACTCAASSLVHVAVSGMQQSGSQCLLVLDLPSAEHVQCMSGVLNCHPTQPCPTAKLGSNPNQACALPHQAFQHGQSGSVCLFLQVPAHLLACHPASSKAPPAQASQAKRGPAATATASWALVPH